MNQKSMRKKSGSFYSEEHAIMNEKKERKKNTEVGREEGFEYI